MIGLADRITPEEERIVDSMVEWYVGEALVLWKEAERNAAFFKATEVAMGELNRVAEERFTKVFRALLGDDPSRFTMLRSYYATSIKHRLGDPKKIRLEETRSWPRPAVKLVDPHPGELTLKNYLVTLTALMESGREEANTVRALDGKPYSDGVQFARQVWAAMKNARVFDFPFEDFIAIYRASDQYTCEKIARFPYNDSTAISVSGGTTHYVESINDAGSKVPFPDQMPFDNIYIGLGHGVPLQDHQILSRVGRAASGRVIGAGILGYMIWTGAEGGEVVEVIQIVEAKDNYILPNVVCHRGVWHDSVLTLAPWIVTHLIGAINDHRQIILGQPTRPTAGQRRDFEKTSKKFKVQGMIPRPYYLVRLEKKLIEDAGKRNRDRLAKIARELSYRHDRRGHERCYIQRGKIPLASKDVKKLEDAGYKIWTITEPDSNAYRQLMERGQPPKANNEWIAILTRWIDPQIVGPEDKPYIPAIRIPTRDEGAQRSTASPGVPRES